MFEVANKKGIDGNKMEPSRLKFYSGLQVRGQWFQCQVSKLEIGQVVRTLSIFVGWLRENPGYAWVG